ncbi:MAG: TldD/PmbA family protein [Deltaproteobacteria bacterium]|nr:TldD/PmbA family protein [Deltaproteobacteria bacterium]
MWTVQPGWPRRLFALISLALTFLPFAGCKPAPVAAPRSEPAAAQAASDEGETWLLDRETYPAVLAAMRQELDRSRTQLKAKDFPAPYFTAYRINDLRQVNIAGRAGGLHTDSSTRQRGLYTEVRVGDYGFDNTGGSRYQSGGGFGFMGWSRPPLLSLDADVQAIRFDLWSGTDQAYKQAVSQFFQRRASHVSRVDRYKTGSFARAQPVQFEGEPVRFDPDAARWRDRVRRLSARLRETPEVLDADVRYTAYGVERYFVNSEGTAIAEAFTNYSIFIIAQGRADDGQQVETVRPYYGRTQEDLPSFDQLLKDVESAAQELVQIRNAPVQTPYTGPVILSPSAAGVYFHEAVGHRLEGERQDDDEGGQTFADKLDMEIIPTFIDVFDDPTQDRESGITLNGHYRYDDEGVPAQRVELVRSGVLKDFLLSRSPIRNRDRSNGHGRAGVFSAPMARMGNLIVRSSHTLPKDRLFEELRAEATRQGKPYGLYVEEVDGGETNTSRWGVQSFKGVARKLYQVDAATGKLTLVRGADIVGTPLASIRKITVTGDDYHVFNGFCGAESGYIPVAAVAPSVLVTEVELQRRSEEPLTQPILKPPTVTR